MIIFSVVKSVIKTMMMVSMKGLKQGYHVTRYYMYRHLSAVMKNGHHAKNILSISHSTNLCKQLFDMKNSQIIEANYPACNILALLLKMNLIT